MIFFITVHANGCLTVNTNNGLRSSICSSQLPLDFKKLLVCLPLWLQGNTIKFSDTIFQEKCRVIINAIWTTSSISILSCLLITVMTGSIASYCNTKWRSDAGSLTHQRGQRLCVSVTKRWGKTGIQTLLCSKGNHVKDQQYRWESANQCLVF